MRNTRYLFTAILAVLLTVTFTLGTFSLPAGASQLDKLLSGRWICYNPSACNPNTDTWPSEEYIRRDLEVIQVAGFTGIITYNSNAGQMAPAFKIAHDLGLKVAAGVWAPTSQQELDSLIANADWIDMVIMGNEGLYFGRYNPTQLSAAIEQVKSQTGLPCATSEPFHVYLDNPNLLKQADFHMVNIHPFFANLTDPSPAVNYTAECYQQLCALSPRPVFIKETGLPTFSSDGKCSEEKQMEYFLQLNDDLRTRGRFAYFEAYNQTWKKIEGDPTDRDLYLKSLSEPYWGMWSENREPKMLAQLFNSQKWNQRRARAWFTVGFPGYFLLGGEKPADQAPFIRGGRLYLPVRFAAYGMGIDETGVNWDGTEVVLRRGANEVRLKVGSELIGINGRTERMDVPPILENGRVFVPIRWTAQGFGFETVWESDTSTVYLIAK